MCEKIGRLSLAGLFSFMILSCESFHNPSTRMCSFGLGPPYTRMCSWIGLSLRSLVEMGELRSL